MNKSIKLLAEEFYLFFIRKLKPKFAWKIESKRVDLKLEIMTLCLIIVGEYLANALTLTPKRLMQSNLLAN